MNKKLSICLAISLILTLSLALLLAGCSEELPSEVSADNSSFAESSSAVTDNSSTEATSSATEESSVAAESSDLQESSESEESSETESSSEETAEPSVDPSEPEESSEEPDVPSEEPSEPDESSEEPDEPSEPDESSEEPDEPSEPDESSEEPDEPSQPDEPSEDPSEPEVIEPDGSGTEEDPYLYIPLENEPVTTVKISGQSSVFCSIYRVGGMNLTVASNDIYVVYDGITYFPEGGILTLSVENALASTPILFEIGNNGSEPQSFELVFASPLGTISNPEIRDTMSEDTVVSLEAGNEWGYFYRHVAQQDGTIRFYLTATEASVIVATNNRSFAQRSSDESENVDDQGRQYFDIEVQKGDEISINMGALPNRRGKYPATEITWSAEYL